MVTKSIAGQLRLASCRMVAIYNLNINICVCGWGCVWMEPFGLAKWRAVCYSYLPPLPHNEAQPDMHWKGQKKKYKTRPEQAGIAGSRRGAGHENGPIADCWPTITSDNENLRLSSVAGKQAIAAAVTFQLPSNIKVSGLNGVVFELELQTRELKVSYLKARGDTAIANWSKKGDPFCLNEPFYFNFIVESPFQIDKNSHLKAEEKTWKEFKHHKSIADGN